MRITQSELGKLDKVTKLNIVNSISGIKPGNLIGTKSKAGIENLAIFSSVVHLGSDPPLLGFILRPHHEFRRDTYANIIETGYFTINHIPTHMTEKAHFTSAKFEAEESEFEKCKIEPYYSDSFFAPYVKESGVKIGLKYVESIPITINDTAMIIGEVVEIDILDKAVSEDGRVDLQIANSAGVSGLNMYYKLEKVGEYPFARLRELPNFDK
jgi:flavin reductase (DIM6/NTAB) family NADH-FMN oxidoreductase RutF